MLESRPKTCNICGGKVEYVALKRIFGQYLKYGSGSGYCYHCTQCDAIVGTHKSNPLEAYGLLADSKTRKLRQENHALFDKLWRNKAERIECYNKLADEMGIPHEECHFGNFNYNQLIKANAILLKWWLEKYDR